MVDAVNSADESLDGCREALRFSVQKVCQDFDANAVLLIDNNICEPMLKSYLGTPGCIFEELDLPIAHVQPLTGTGLTSVTAAKIQQHLNTVFIVRNSPTLAQLVAQHILEIRRYAPIWSLHLLLLVHDSGCCIVQE